MALKQITIEPKLVNMDLKQSHLAMEIKEALRAATQRPYRAAPQQLPPASQQLRPAPQQQIPPAPQQMPQAPQQLQAVPQQLPQAPQQLLAAPQQLSLAPWQQQLGPQQPAPQGQTQAPKQATTCGTKMVWVGDSIAHHIDFEDIEKAVKTKIKKKKAYGSVKASSQKFPDSNFTDVVPRELSGQQADILVMQASSVDLTNIPADNTQV